MLRVRLFQDHRRRFDGRAAQVILPSNEGDVAVLEFHAPMLCAMNRGTVQIDEATFAVRGGVARVARNIVTILAT